MKYKIKFTVPADYDASVLFKTMPSPIDKSAMAEIYNYAIEPDGFYFVDRLINPSIASLAFKLFVDEALRISGSIEIVEL